MGILILRSSRVVSSPTCPLFCCVAFDCFTSCRINFVLISRVYFASRGMDYSAEGYPGDRWPGCSYCRWFDLVSPSRLQATQILSQGARYRQLLRSPQESICAIVLFHESSQPWPAIASRTQDPIFLQRNVPCARTAQKLRLEYRRRTRTF